MIKHKSKAKQYPDHEVFTVYTDGSWSPQDGRGGWAAHIIQHTGNLTHLMSNASMVFDPHAAHLCEIKAVIDVLSFLPPNAVVFLYTDSRFVLHFAHKQDNIAPLKREREELQTAMRRHHCIFMHVADKSQPITAFVHRMANAARNSLSPKQGAR